MSDTETDSTGQGGQRIGDSEAGPLSVESNPLSRWILINGNRWTVSAVALTLTGFGLVGIGVLWTNELANLFTEEPVVQTIIIALFSGIILLVSIAVSVNSIVLSQEITSLGDQEEEIDETFSFRDSVQEQTDADVSPARPAAFLQVIFDAIRTDVQELHESISNGDSALHNQIRRVKYDIENQVATAERRLENGEFGTAEVLFAGIQYNYSRQVYSIRQLRAEHEEALTDGQQEKIDELLTTLKYFTIGREYFKTLYFKRELANLSRGLIVISFPSLVFITYSILSLSAGLLPAFSLFGAPSIIWFVTLTYVVGLAPYAFFSAYVLRTSTIAAKTLAAGPFILETGNDSY